MRKKILAVIAIVISALILIGCGTEDMEMTGDYLKLLARESKSERHELIEECMDFYNVCGTKELNEKQVVDFCRMKGLVIMVCLHQNQKQIMHFYFMDYII